MKNLIATILLTFLLFIPSFAQVYSDRYLEPAPEKKTQYDKFEDKTTVSLTFQITEKFSAIFEDTFSGTVRKSKLTELRLSFILLDPDIDYLDKYCIFLADDNRIRLQNGSSLRSYGDEIVSFSISIEDFKKIANAEKVEMKIGSKGINFSKMRLQAMEEFYKQLVP